MVWIRLWLSCAAFLSAAGGISYGLVKLSEKFWKPENPALVLALYKLALMLYWVPVSFVWIGIFKTTYEDGKISYNGEFFCSTTPSMRRFFSLLGMLWLVGFLLSVLWSGIKKYRLAVLMKGNVPVEHPHYFAIFEECRRAYGLHQVALRQNDLITSPITEGLFKNQVVLPFSSYTDTELRMIYEHELTHIKNKDLHWRIFALVTSWIHWFNPVIYLQKNELDCVQEIVCDLSIALKNKNYTKKEDAVFLAKLAEQEVVQTGMLALMKNKNQTIRRMKKMVNTKELVRTEKRSFYLSGAVVSMLALIPTTICSAKVAGLQEDWIRAEEVVTVEKPQRFDNTHVEESYYDDGSVVEVEQSPDEVIYKLEKRINANTRYFYPYRSVSAGDEIFIMTHCDDAVTYSVGIKNKDTDEIRTISGSGTIIHLFEISESGMYAVFIENNNDHAIKFVDEIMY